MAKAVKHTGMKPEDELFNELSRLIEKSQGQVVTQANSTLNLLFWNIGRLINDNILQHKRAEYGKQIVFILSKKLTAKYGRNFELKNLRRMLQFAAQFTDEHIVVTLSRQLSWSHFLALIPLKTHESRLFYARQVVQGLTGVRALRKAISDKTYERTAIANIQASADNPAIYNTFKDPYFLDFLGLQNTWLEKDLEAAILQELKSFILELLCKGLHNSSYAHRFVM